MEWDTTRSLGLVPCVTIPPSHYYFTLVSWECGAEALCALTLEVKDHVTSCALLGSHDFRHVHSGTKPNSLGKEALSRMLVKSHTCHSSV